MSPAALAAVAALWAGVPVPGAAGDGAVGRDTLTLRDDLGRRVRLEAPPERIVSLVPAFTEILFAVGAGGRLAGRTRYGVHPREARRVPSVGEGVRPSLEMVVAREPDLVLLYAGAENRSAAEQLEGLGVPALALEHDGIGDLFRNLALLGRLTGREEPARRLKERLRCQLETVGGVASEPEPRRVYYEVWADPPMTVGAGSYLDSLLAVAGGVNVFGDLEAPSPRVGLEAVTARRPDLVLVSRRGAGSGAAPVAGRPGWDVLEAVREGRVREVDGDLVHRLGPRLGEAAAALAATLHPELEGRLRRALRERCPPAAGRGGGPARVRDRPRAAPGGERPGDALAGASRPGDPDSG